MQLLRSHAHEGLPGTHSKPSLYPQYELFPPWNILDFFSFPKAWQYTRATFYWHMNQDLVRNEASCMRGPRRHNSYMRPHFWESIALTCYPEILGIVMNADKEWEIYLSTPVIIWATLYPHFLSNIEVTLLNRTLPNCSRHPNVTQVSELLLYEQRTHCLVQTFFQSFREECLFFLYWP